MTAADVLWGRAELGATATFCSECGAPEQVGMAQRMESVTPPGGVMLSASTAQLVDSSAVLGEAVLVQIKGADKPVRARRLLGIGDRHRAGRAESNLVGRRWEMSAVAGLLDRAIDGTARWSAWWGHQVLARVACCARRRRWRVNAVWKCSLPSASRTPVRSPSMPSHGCCARLPVSRALTGRKPAIMCATGSLRQTGRTCCCSMTCWGAPIRMFPYGPLIATRVGGG